jgi:hypothetical protein
MSAKIVAFPLADVANDLCFRGQPAAGVALGTAGRRPLARREGAAEPVVSQPAQAG